MPTIIIKERRAREVRGPASKTVFTDRVFSGVTSLSDVVYGMVSPGYSTNINAFNFGDLPFNDTLTFEE